eukprot:TRINITY_DN6473_c0_g1_i12.p1 TRINITY_DN6473_c0_g1~~TRINITY_DN6473_c0_g1_i12.p1  ORF type:complete len:623 (+),score=127.17 TRINITY_DN6473_c0_g1_i12:157-2025(+)
MCIRDSINAEYGGSWLTMLVLLLLLLCSGAWGSVPMYTVIGMREPFRILSGTSEIGWGSSYGGAVAGLVTLEDWRSSSPRERMAVMVPGEEYTVETLAALKDKVTAVVLSQNATHRPNPSMCSTASKFPNKQWGIDPDSDTEWNRYGNGELMARASYATLSVDQADWQALLEKAEGNLERSPRYAIEVTAFMWATTDTQTCLRRGFCDPIGGTNMLASLQNWTQVQHKNVVLAVASVDSDAAVRGDAIGARAISGAIALAAAAGALSRCQQNDVSTRNIVFAFTDADQWGYTGSRALANQLGKTDDISPYLVLTNQSSEPVQGTGGILDRTDYILGVGEIGADSPSLFSHVPKDFGDAKAQKELQNLLAKQPGANIKQANGTGGLPPSAVHSYLLNRDTIPGVVLSEDLNSELSNRYVSSTFDNYDNLSPASVVRATQQLSRALAVLSNGADEMSTTKLDECANAVNSTLLLGWLEWATGSPVCSGSCSEFAAKYGPGPVHSYSSIVQSSLTSRLTQSLLDEFVHLKSSVVLTQAVSPGLKFTSRRRSWKVHDASEPIFSESKWKYTQLRVFKQDPVWLDWVILGVGLVLLMGHVYCGHRLLNTTGTHWRPTAAHQTRSALD